MKKILLICFMMLILMSCTSALDSLGEFKQGSEIRITQVCSTATYINITSIADPNSQVVGQASNYVQFNGMGFLRINKYDNITLKMQDVGATTSGTAYTGNVNLVRVGN